MMINYRVAFDSSCYLEKRLKLLELKVGLARLNCHEVVVSFHFLFVNSVFSLNFLERQILGHRP